MSVAIKSIKQPFHPTAATLEMMETFRRMVNDSIRLGLEHNVSTMKKLSWMAYQKLACYDTISYYKLCAMSHAAGILANRDKSIKRGFEPRRPHATRPMLISCYGFKILDGVLKIPLGNRQYHDIPVNGYVRSVLSDASLKIRSFTLTPDSLSICYSREVKEIECSGIDGVDRNLRNLTVGNRDNAIQYDLSEAVDIAENTRCIMGSVKRNDVRIRRKLYQKYGKRRKRRTNQLLHRLTKAIIQNANQNKAAIAFEDIRRIRKAVSEGQLSGTRL